MRAGIFLLPGKKPANRVYQCLFRARSTISVRIKSVSINSSLKQIRPTGTELRGIKIVMTTLWGRIKYFFLDGKQKAIRSAQGRKAAGFACCQIFPCHFDGGAACCGSAVAGLRAELLAESSANPGSAPSIRGAAWLIHRSGQLPGPREIQFHEPPQSLPKSPQALPADSKSRNR